MWLPAFEKLEKNDLSEVVSKNLWTQLNLGAELEKSERESLLNLLKKYAEIFPSTENRLGFCPIVEHYIDTGDAKP